MAFTRAVSPSLAACELTHMARTPIQVDRAVAQHARYEDALQRVGCTVQRVAPAPEHPDAVFIEDTAVVLNEVAIITRPGAESRRGETQAVAPPQARSTAATSSWRAAASSWAARPAPTMTASRSWRR